MFDQMLVVSGWYGILCNFCRGGVDVYVFQVLVFNIIELRGEQVVCQIEMIFVIFGVEKVNLIGYSYGSFIFCYVVGIYL